MPLVKITGGGQRCAHGALEAIFLQGAIRWESSDAPVVSPFRLRVLVRTGLFCASLQITSNESGQGSGVDGFGNVAVAARGEDALFISLHRVGREADDRDVARRGIGLQTSRQFEAIDARQLNIH